MSALGGGISNTVLLAEWEGGAVVVKQPLAQLRVDDEWSFDRARVFVERDCMATLADRLPGSAPEVVFSDDARYVFGMTLAPRGGVVWRDEHDAGADPRARSRRLGCSAACTPRPPAAPSSPSASRTRCR